MKKLITIENYEAFYLDFLEGNLNQEEKIALELFFKEHPELKLDDEDLPFLSIDSTIELTDFEKELLKKNDEEQIINTDNVEYFLVAEVENQLSDEQKIKLNNLVNQSDELKLDRAIYAKTIVPAESVIYPNKNELIQESKGKIIPLWLLGSSIAAASIGFFFFFQSNQHPINGTISIPQFAIQKKIKNTEGIQYNHMNNVIEYKNENPSNEIIRNNELPNEKLLQYEMEKGPFEPIVADNNSNKNLDKKEEKKENEEQKLPNDLPIISPGNDYVNAKTKETNVDLAANSGMSGLYNPIPLVTKTMSDRLHTTVEFKKHKDKTKKGFFLKIGKLVIDRTN